MQKIFTPSVRLWIYGIFASLAPMLVALGVIEGTVAGYSMAIVSAVLGITNGMAAADVNRTPK
jgi:hypothetical protein